LISISYNCLSPKC